LIVRTLLVAALLLGGASAFGQATGALQNPSAATATRAATTTAPPAAANALSLPTSPQLPTVSTPAAVSGAPPTTTPAFPGLPVPPLTASTTSVQPPSPLQQDLRPSFTAEPVAVASVQATLAADGFYHGPIDGQLSGTTRAAIAAFQQSARLPVTGQLDEPTASALGLLTGAARTTTTTTTTTTTGMVPFGGTTTVVQPTQGATTTSTTPFPITTPAFQSSGVFIQP
jgi:hypothetical protein